MYTSSRTVRSTKPKAATPVKQATADARRIVGPMVNGAHITSAGTADPITLASQVRTVITFPSARDAETIASALKGLPNIVRIITDPNGVTIIRAL